MKKLLLITLLSSMLFGCGSESSKSYTIYMDCSYPYTTSCISDWSDFRTVTKANEVIASVDTSDVSIGIYDTGFQYDHEELAGRVVHFDYDKDQILGILSSELPADDPKITDWMLHGSHVAGIAAGKTIGMAPQAQIVTALNRFVSGGLNYSVNSQSGYNYFNDVIAPPLYEYSPLDVDPVSGECFEGSDQTQCYSHVEYYLQKMIENKPTTFMPVINFSFGEPYVFFMKKFVDFNQYNSQDITDFSDLAYYNENGLKGVTPVALHRYKRLRSLLADGETVITQAVANYDGTLTELYMNKYDSAKAMDNQLAPYLKSVFDDYDEDTNHNGIIEDEERGVTGAMLFVGNSTNQGEVYPYAMKPGADKRVQARFILAPGETIKSVDYKSNTGLRSLTGTSMSTAVVSGAIALLKAKYPHKTAREIVDVMLKTTDKGGNAENNYNSVVGPYTPETHGQGVLDVEAADKYLSEH